MADVQSQIPLESLGTKEKTYLCAATIAVTAGADTKHTVAVVFEKAFVVAPKILGTYTKDAASNKGVPSVDSVTATGMNVNLYQIGAGDLATADHVVYVTYIGWVKAA